MVYEKPDSFGKKLARQYVSEVTGQIIKSLNTQGIVALLAGTECAELGVAKHYWGQQRKTTHVIDYNENATGLDIARIAGCKTYAGQLNKFLIDTRKAYRKIKLLHHDATGSPSLLWKDIYENAARVAAPGAIIMTTVAANNRGRKGENSLMGAKDELMDNFSTLVQSWLPNGWIDLGYLHYFSEAYQSRTSGGTPMAINAFVNLNDTRRLDLRRTEDKRMHKFIYSKPFDYARLAFSNKSKNLDSLKEAFDKTSNDLFARSYGKTQFRTRKAAKLATHEIFNIDPTEPFPARPEEETKLEVVPKEISEQFLKDFVLAHSKLTVSEICVFLSIDRKKYSSKIAGVRAAQTRKENIYNSPVVIAQRSFDEKVVFCKTAQNLFDLLSEKQFVPYLNQMNCNFLKGIK